jgi:hypothetical protein
MQVQTAHAEIQACQKALIFHKKLKKYCCLTMDFYSASSLKQHSADKHVARLRDDQDRLIVTISQNSIGNAITELLGVVVKRTPNASIPPCISQRVSPCG